MKVLTIASLKGGVSKTTIAIFLAQAFAFRGSRTLVIDADPNNNASDYFLRAGDLDSIDSANLYHVLTGKKSFEQCTHQAGFNLSVLPATPALHKVGAELGTNPGSILRFCANVRKAPFDFVVIDTPPAIGYELRAALHAADVVLSPVAPNRWTLQALDILREELQTVAEGMGTAPALRCVPSIVTEKEKAKLSGLVPELTRAAILKAAGLKNSGMKGKTLSQKTKSWNEFLELAQEVV